MLIDDHAHILNQYYSDKEIEDIVERCRHAGVKYVVNNGLNPETNREVLGLGEKYDILKPALGGYPIDLIEKNVDVDSETDFILKNKEKVFAIGEVGLDYKFIDQINPDEHKKMQKHNFQRFIELSERIGKALIVHSRKAESEVVDMLESSSNKGVVMHTFSGNFKLAKRIADNGWMFSVPANIVFARHFQEIVERFEISRILTETDSPLLSPFKELRDSGEKNAPYNVAESVKKIAEIKKLDPVEVENLIFMNFQRTFL